MKKVVLVLFIAICSCSLMFAYKECFSQVVICDGTISKSEIEETITESVDSQLEDLDFSSVEDVLNSLNNEQYELLGSSSFFDKVKKIINGEFSQNQQSLFSAILNLIFENIMRENLREINYTQEEYLNLGANYKESKENFFKIFDNVLFLFSSNDG